MNQKRIFIIHGWEGAPESNWFPWLKKQLEKQGEILRDKLGAELIIVQKGSHFHEGAGFTELPIVLESLLKIYAKRKI
ncbi:hypothetical protein KKE99_00155, partial [Patescibacteria group bacterium]|nr:hypothetical protein [Patescibacteria group bacterium]